MFTTSTKCDTQSPLGGNVKPVLHAVARRPAKYRPVTPAVEHREEGHVIRARKVKNFGIIKQEGVAPVEPDNPSTIKGVGNVRGRLRTFDHNRFMPKLAFIMPRQHLASILVDLHSSDGIRIHQKN